MDNIKEKIIEIIKKICSTDIDLATFFSNNDDLGKIGLSSLQYIQLIVYIEEEFGVEFGVDAFQEEYFKNFNKIIEFIEKQSH